jgi:3-oxoacyl-[acyl-carrier-protein] synthase-3
MEATRARILGIGAYSPEKVLTNHDLEKMVDTSDEWIVERTGISERHIAADDEASSDLATQAGRRAIADAGLMADDIDLLICASVTGDMPFPATACFVQANLGLKNAAAFDIAAGCTGFLYGLNLAQGLIRSGAYRRILLIGGEVLSRTLDWTDRATCVLLGDSAGAVVLGPAAEDEGGILATRIASDGTKAELLYIPGGGSRNPASHQTVDDRLHYFKMNGRETFKHATRNMAAIAKQVLEDSGLGLDDVNLLVPHQANLRIITYIAEQLGVPMEKVYTNVQRYGNTSSASIPLALTEARERGKLKKGDVVLMVAFGTGLTWGATLLRW